MQWDSVLAASGMRVRSLAPHSVLKHLALLQLWLRLQLQFGFDPWPRTPYATGQAKTKKKKKIPDKRVVTAF